MSVVIGNGKILQFLHHLLTQGPGESGANGRCQPSLNTPTIDSNTREKARATTTTSRAVLKSGSRARLPGVFSDPLICPERMSSTMYCWSFGGISSAATPTHVSTHSNTAPRRYGAEVPPPAGESDLSACNVDKTPRGWKAAVSRMNTAVDR